MPRIKTLHHTTRVALDLEPHHIELLDKLSAENNTSRAVTIRQILDDLLARNHER